MYSVRAVLDSYIYWGIFIFATVFMGYFLVSLIGLTSAENDENNRAAMYGYIPRAYLTEQSPAPTPPAEAGY